MKPLTLVESAPREVSQGKRKKRRRRSRSKKRPKKSGLWYGGFPLREAGSVFSLFVASFLGLTLAVWAPGNEVNHWTGPVGRWVGDSLFGSLGVLAITLPPLLVILGLGSLVRWTFPLPIRSVIAVLTAILSAMGLLHLTELTWGRPSGFPPLGGWLGGGVAGLLVPFLRRFGAGFALFGLLSVSMVVALGEKALWLERIARTGQRPLGWVGLTTLRFLVFLVNGLDTVGQRVSREISSRWTRRQPEMPSPPDESLEPVDLAEPNEPGLLNLPAGFLVEPTTDDGGESSTPEGGSVDDERGRRDEAVDDVETEPTVVVVERSQPPFRRRGRRTEDGRLEAIPVTEVCQDPIDREGVSEIGGETSLLDEDPAYAPTTHRYVLPDLGLLEEPEPDDREVLDEELQQNSRLLVSKLGDFGIEGQLRRVRPGPVITRYEFEPAAGIKMSRIVNLADDLALALKAIAAPRVARIPKSSSLGIELPNHHRQTVHFKTVVGSESFQDHPSLLRLALGVDIAGHPYVADLANMPHLLIAGATGAGKSVCVNSLITSLLLNGTPEQIQLLLIDPKMLELSIYNEIPHLLEEVIIEPKQAATALSWAVDEMERRYKRLSRRQVRNIGQYNELVEDEPIPRPTKKDPEPEPEEPLPYVVIVIDEFADLIMVSGKEVENSITRLAQKARAAGIHLILATQRPSVDVITGSIKANFPSRISFKVASKVDSRTVLDQNGAEKLLGKGDLFFLAPGSGQPIRIHGCFLTEKDILRVVDHWSPQPPIVREESSIFEQMQGVSEEDFAAQDELYEKAVRHVVTAGHASISHLQRRLRVGHARAARLMDMMELDGVVGEFQGSKTREVIWKPEQLPPAYGVG